MDFADKGLYSQRIGFSSSHVWMREGDHKEGWAPKNWCFRTVALEKTLESHLDSRRSSQSVLKEINLNIHWKAWCWSWSSSTLATWYKEPTHWKRSWWWKRLKAGGEGGDRGWEGWMASLTQWTWIWANSRDSGGQRNLASCSPWSHKELDMTLWLNNNKPRRSHFSKQQWLLLLENDILKLRLALAVLLLLGYISSRPS